MNHNQIVFGDGPPDDFTGVFLYLEGIGRNVDEYIRLGSMLAMEEWNYYQWLLNRGFHPPLMTPLWWVKLKRHFCKHRHQSTFKGPTLHKVFCDDCGDVLVDERAEVSAETIQTKWADDDNRSDS